MKLPWVSRELYERTLEDLRRSELERRELLDRLIGAPPGDVVTPEALIAAMTKTATEDPEVFSPATMSPETPSGLRKMAQHEANRRAGRVA